MNRKVVFSLALALSLASLGAAPEELPPYLRGYRKWAHTAEKPLTYRIPGHGDTYRVIYINDVGTRVKVSEKDGRKFYEYPPGTVLVKEIYFKDASGNKGKFHYHGIMRKLPGDSYAWDGWRYEHTMGGELTVVDAPFCTNCHARANGPHKWGEKNPKGEHRDFVFYPYRGGKRE